MQAAMMYLRVLRETRRLSQADIARAVGVESKQVYRWERGEGEPPASKLAVFVDVVQGNAEDEPDGPDAQDGGAAARSGLCSDAA